MKNIKDAVIELDGKLPNRTYTKYSNAAGWYISRCGKLTHAIDCVWFEPEEFEDAAKRMGYINGYRYGVEYPTNGNRPDLPGGTLVELTFACGSKYECKTSSTTFESRPIHDPVVVSFRITDEKYKPVDEATEINIAEEVKKELRSVNKKMLSGCCQELGEIQPIDEASKGFEVIKRPEPYVPRKIASVDGIIKNNWHERGELPPVGELVEYQQNREEKRFEKCRVLAHHGVTVVFTLDGLPNSVFTGQMATHLFRPIRTHREKVIEAAVMICAQMKPNIVERMEAIYNAGMLVLPQDSGDTKD